MAEGDILTPAKLGRMLGKSERTLRRWRELRIGPDWFVVGRGVRYRLEAVVRWMTDQEGRVAEIRKAVSSVRHENGLKE
ncbi:MAG: helix-turn-helix domain-containing protein [Pseudomonadota bacterium]